MKQKPQIFILKALLLKYEMTGGIKDNETMVKWRNYDLKLTTNANARFIESVYNKIKALFLECH